jgi:hypothetical protein
MFDIGGLCSVQSTVGSLMAKVIDTLLRSDFYEHAQKVASQYQLKLIPTENGRFVGSSVELPFVLSEGCENEIIATTRGAIVSALVILLRKGRELPPPANSRRNVQVNVRLSSEERELLDTAARTRGYRGISDYLRSIAIENTNRH